MPVRAIFKYVVPQLKGQHYSSPAGWHFNLVTTYLNIALNGVQ